MAEDTYWR